MRLWICNLPYLCGGGGYICPLGAVVNIYQNCMWVKVSDMYVQITKIALQGKEVEISKEFKIGNVLESTLKPT